MINNALGNVAPKPSVRMKSIAVLQALARSYLAVIGLRGLCALDVGECADDFCIGEARSSLDRHCRSCVLQIAAALHIPYFVISREISFR